MNIYTKLILTVAVLLPASVLAAPPPVTGVGAAQHGSEVVVQWDPIEDVPISHYRVYYSFESILENDGLYDDFETTDGPESTITFIPPPHTDVLYVAVIAVADGGLESEFFTSEAWVQLQRTAEPTDQEPPLDHNATVELLKAEATSPTDIVVEFSAAVTVDPTHAPDGLFIEDSTGQRLHIQSITIEGRRITIYTETQVRGTVYSVKFSEPFRGKRGEPLDTDNRSLLVTGHSDGTKRTATSPVRESNPLMPPDVTNMRITLQGQRGGLFDVRVDWLIDNTPGDLAYLVVYQTRDGYNFGPPTALPIETGGVELSGVTPGFWGLYIQTVNIYGHASQGVFEYITLSEHYGSGLPGQLLENAMGDGTNLVSLAPITNDTETSPIPLPERGEASTVPVTGTHTAAETFFGISLDNVRWNTVIILGTGAVTILLVIVSGLHIASRKKKGPLGFFISHV